MTDPIADMLTRIRNAVRARHPRVEIPHSHMKLAIASILKGEGYIAAVATVEKGTFKHIRSEERRVGKECRSRWSPYH